MRIESSGHSQGNPRLYEVVEHTPKTGKSPTVWAWPELMDYLKIAGQPVAGPWPPHQEPRPDPEEDSLPVAVPDPEAARPPGTATAHRTGEQPGRGEQPGLDKYVPGDEPALGEAAAPRDQPAPGAQPSPGNQAGLAGQP